MTVIEKQYMETVIRMGRRLRAARLIGSSAAMR